MKKGSIRKSGIVFLLLLVLFQQVGAGLYIHNLLHAGKESLSHNRHHDTSQEINFACSCVDNFLTPVIETDEPVIQITKSLQLPELWFYSEKVFLTSFTLPALRGPPALKG